MVGYRDGFAWIRVPTDPGNIRTAPGSVRTASERLLIGPSLGSLAIVGLGSDCRSGNSSLGDSDYWAMLGAVCVYRTGPLNTASMPLTSACTGPNTSSQHIDTIYYCNLAPIGH